MVDVDIFIPARHRHTVLFAVVLAIALGSVIFTVVGGYADVEKITTAFGSYPSGNVTRIVAEQEVRSGSTFNVRLEATSAHSTLTIKERLPPGFSIVEGATIFSREPGYFVLGIHKKDSGITYIAKVDSSVKPGTYEIHGIHLDSSNKTYSTGKTVIKVV